MPHPRNAAVVGRTRHKAAPDMGNQDDGVQKESRESGREKARIPRTLAEVLDAGLVPVEDAAAALGIEPKRLRGFLWRNGIADPIGDQDRVYGWSCRTLAAKLAATSRESAVVNESESSHNRGEA